MKQPIGVFDSGLGGLTVAADLHKQLPHEDIVYIGDSKNAPYGTKTKEEIIQLSDNIVKQFIKLNAKAVVIACNTATSAAANELRKKYPELLIIGMEPALKPAVLNTKSGNILVLATPYTIKHEKYQNLVNGIQEFLIKNQKIYSISAPKLVDFIESNNFNESEVFNYLDEIIPKNSNIKAVVLGCTHFLYLKDLIKKYFGNTINIYDGNIGTINNLNSKIKQETSKPGNIKIYNSKSASLTELSKTLFANYQK